jgi:adenine-specific DNA-methyltransferase
MNYIGSKQSLLPFLEKTIYNVCGKDLSQSVFCDLFAGTGAVGTYFKPKVKQIIANDLEYYSYILNRNYIGNTSSLETDWYLNELNNLKGVEGFVFQNYAEGGTSERLYFSAKNGKQIDAIRQHIEAWKTEREILEDIYYFLLASLLESADKVANTASVYGAYLKKIKASAQKPLELKPALFSETNQENLVFQKDANQLIKEIEGDVLYLDPPYNARQYGANYHLLNTIAHYKPFNPKGKTGLPDYNKSDYSSKPKVAAAFEELIKNAKFKYIFLSYNNEGLLPPQQLRDILERYGKYDLATTKYNRFKADKTENRNHKANSVVEYLHVLEK